METSCTWIDVMGLLADYILIVSEEKEEYEKALQIFANTFGNDVLKKRAGNYIGFKNTLGMN